MQIPISVAQGDSADGTRPEQMWTDQNHLAASYGPSERHWNLNLIQARGL